MTTIGPDRTATEAALERVLTSACFEQAERHKRFLDFVVKETLAGRGAQLKGYTIGIAVFDRPANFDPQSDPLVRVEAGRLRSRLAQYYTTEGRDDPVRIVIPKGGYQPEFALTSPVAEPAIPGAESAPGTDGPRPTLRQSGRRRRRRRLASAAVVALLLSAGLLGLAVWHAIGPGGGLSSTDGLPDWPSVYVTPLSNLGTDDSLGFFARGISEEIMLNLRDYELIVIAGDLNGTVPDGPLRLRELRERHDVDYVVSGSVRNDGRTARIVARLTDTRTGEILWSDDHDETLDVASLVATEERMAQEIVRAIAGPYGPIFEREFANLTRTRPLELSTYHCLLRFYDYRRDVDVNLIGEVRDCFAEAVRLEPDYAEACAGLSLMLQDGLLYGPRQQASGDALAEAREAARHALDVNGNSVLAHLAMQRIRILEGDIEGFRRNVDRLIELAPTDPVVLQAMSQVLIVLGDVTHGRALLERAAKLDVNPSIHRYVTETLLHLSRHKFDAALQAAVRIDAPNWYASHMFVAVAAGLDGQETMARGAAGRLLELRPDFAAEARGIFETFRMHPELRESMLEGLRRAGIEVE